MFHGRDANTAYQTIVNRPLRSKSPAKSVPDGSDLPKGMVCRMRSWLLHLIFPNDSGFFGSIALFSQLARNVTEGHFLRG